MAIKFFIQYEKDGNLKSIVNGTEELFNKNIQAINAKGYKLIKKTRLYPIGNWNTYQHVFYNANDRAWNALYEARETGTDEDIEKAEEWLDKVQDLLGKFDLGYKDSTGMVYVEYNDYKSMKDIIGAYAFRHNGYV